MFSGRRLIHLASQPIYTYASSMPVSTASQGDLNNTSAARPNVSIEADPEYKYFSLAISEYEDDPVVRKTYRPFLLEKNDNVADWIKHLELATVTKMALDDIQRTNERLKVLVLYGSLRQRFVDGSGFFMAAFAYKFFHRLAYF